MSEEELKERIERLEKEADWLAVQLYVVWPYDWREVARRVVANQENAWKENWYTL